MLLAELSDNLRALSGEPADYAPLIELAGRARYVRRPFGRPGERLDKPEV